MTVQPQGLASLKSLAVGKKLAIATGFNKQASQYDLHSQVQKDIANHALNIFSTLLPKPACTLDLGCGTGAYMSRLQTFSQALIGLDISSNMLLQARENWLQQTKHSAAIEQSKDRFFINADAESLPLLSSSIDSVFSSMALQWCFNPQILLAEVHRVLKPKGKAVLAILVDGSFEQLHNAYTTLGIASRLNRFATVDDWLSACKKLAWQVQYDEHFFVTEHTSFIDILHSIKRVGAAVKTHSDVPTHRHNAVTADPSKAKINKSLASATLHKIKRNTFISRSEIKNISKILTTQSDDKATMQLQYKVLFLTISK